MKILCIYPYLDPEVNSIAEAILYLGRQGHEVKVLSARQVSSFKGDLFFAKKSEYPNVTFYRPFENLQALFHPTADGLDRAHACLDDFQPDLVYCSLQHNMKLATALARDFNAPVVLLVESARDPAQLLPFRGVGLLKRFGLSWMLAPAARLYWRKLARQTQAIMVTNPADQPHLREMTLPGREVVYVPWCTEIPEPDQYHKPGNRKTGIHVGGLNRFKNAGALAPAIRILLEQTDTEHFTVVGPGPYAASIQALAARFPGQVTYIESLPRREALAHMSGAGYGLLTAKEGALGFMGDCFGLKLPLVSLHNPGGFLAPGTDALVTWGCDRLASTVNRLIEDEALRTRISAMAHCRYVTENTADAVGQQYEAIFESVLSRETSTTISRPEARRETVHAR